jgi:hypothetical protein
VKAHLLLSSAALAGIGILVAVPTVMAQNRGGSHVTLPSAVAKTVGSPACDDATGLAAAITSAIGANPGLAASIAGAAAERCPTDAALIATAAVNASPNAANAVVDAVIDALPEKDKDNEILTSAIIPLSNLQPPNAPGPDGVNAPLKAPWTDPQGRRLLTGNSSPR